MWQRLLFLVSAVSYCRAQCSADQPGCFPPIGDLTLGRTFNVTSSCADGEEYVIDSSDDELLLECSSSSNSVLSINDDDENTNWVSSINASSQLPFVIQLEFEAPVVFYNATITWATRTPTALILERNNGTDWLPYRYYAEDCLSSFSRDDIPASTFPNSQDAICTSNQLQNTSGAMVRRIYGTL